MASVTSLPGEVDRTISATVIALYKGRRMTTAQLEQRSGIAHATLNGRLRCLTSWTAAEVRTMADIFEVRVSDLYDGLGGTFSPTDPDGIRVGRSYSSATRETATELMQYQSPVAA